MQTRDYIEQHQQQRQEEKIQYEILSDGDAIILNQRYAGMRLSDIFIVNPDFIEWVLHDNRFGSDLRFVANILKRDTNMFAHRVTAQINRRG